MLIRQVFFLPLLLFSVLLSCKQTIQITYKPVDFSITSPRTGWVYYENIKIMLAVNADTDDIIWTSTISGYLGEGNHLTLFLPKGLHGICAEIQGVKKERYIYISPASGGMNNRSILINYTPLDVKIKTGTYYSYLSTNSGTVNDFTISPIVHTQKRQYQNKRFHSDILPKELLRDTRLHLPKAGIYVEKRGKKIRSNIIANIQEMNRTFYVINTQSQYGLPHQIEAELWYQSEILSVWLPVNSILSDDLFNQCIETIEAIIIPRVYSLWGKSADIDGDERIALLFSNTLNEEGIALGFFNPADYFERNTNMALESYNPSSNEMDIVYVAFPNDDQSSSYYINNVIATIAHELTHASTFTAKTYNRIKNGNTDALREELFLDEGWSHLTENLCGFGISGGNIKFLNRFFDNTSLYSFCGVNQYGQEDSAGMRGAMTLFLSWLFWKAGGMSWNSANPVELLDQGGISFLKRMIDSPETGWESIGNAFGKPVYMLYNEMLNEMNSYRILDRNYVYAIDPFTNEAVDFFVNMGVLTVPNSTHVIETGFPKLVSSFSPSTLLPWSFVFFEPFDVLDDAVITLHANTVNNNIFFTLQ